MISPATHATVVARPASKSKWLLVALALVMAALVGIVVGSPGAGQEGSEAALGWVALVGFV